MIGRYYNLLIRKSAAENIYRDLFKQKNYTKLIDHYEKESPFKDSVRCTVYYIKSMIESGRETELIWKLSRRWQKMVDAKHQESMEFGRVGKQTEKSPIIVQLVKTRQEKIAILLSKIGKFILGTAILSILFVSTRRLIEQNGMFGGEIEPSRIIHDTTLYSHICI